MVNGSTSENTVQTRRRSPWSWVAAVVVFLACVAGLSHWLEMRGSTAKAQSTAAAPKAAPEARLLNMKQLTNDGLRKQDLVSDGSRLYFSEISGGHPVIMRMSVAGGDQPTALATKVADPTVLDASPQGELLVASGTWGKGDLPFWNINGSTGTSHQLGKVRGTAGTWRPDGKLLFSSGRDLYLAEHDGSKPVKLSTLPGPAYSLRASPDSSHIRVTFGDPTVNSLMWEGGADGKHMVPVLPLPDQPLLVCCGTWIRDGKYFLFGDAAQIWIVQIGLTPQGRVREPTQLTTGDVHYFSPVASGDGTKVFAIGAQHKAGTNAAVSEIYAFDLQIP